MTTERVTLFLSLLAVLAQLVVASALVLLVAGHFSATASRWRHTAIDAVGPSALTLACLVAVVSMVGSLYFSEHAHFIPCKLCWYQRIAMYPLAPILGIAAWRRDLGIRPYVITLAGIGAAISTYHVVLERYPSLESSVCDPANPCTLIWVKRLGYITIPTMALSGFALIITLALSARPNTPDALDEGDRP